MNRIYTFLASIVILALATFASTEVNAQSNNEIRFEMNSGIKKMSVYPTPATNFVNISLPLSLRENIDRIQVIDIAGRIVLEEKIVNKSNTTITLNNLSNLSNGTYIITAKDSEGRMLQSSKMIISK